MCIRRKTDIFHPSCGVAGNPRILHVVVNGSCTWRARAKNLAHIKIRVGKGICKKNSNVLLHGSRNMLKQSPRILPVRFELQAYYLVLIAVPSRQCLFWHPPWRWLGCQEDRVATKHSWSSSLSISRNEKTNPKFRTAELGHNPRKRNNNKQTE